MRSMSQLVLAVLLIGVAVAAGSMFSYIVANLLNTYQPSQVMIVRVGDVDVNLVDVCDEVVCQMDGPCPCPTTGYRFSAVVNLANLGSKNYRISGGDIVLLIKGVTGQGKIVRCDISTNITLHPGEIGRITASCFLPDDWMGDLFGVTRPPFDEIKENAVFLYIKIYNFNWYIL